MDAPLNPLDIEIGLHSFLLRFKLPQLLMAGQLEILLIEDTESDAELFLRAVERSGLTIRVQTVTSTLGGMEYLSGGGIYRNRSAFPLPHAVVVGLRSNSGFEFLKWCRETETGKRLSVFVLAGAGEEDERIEKALQFGADDVFFKARTVREQIQVVREIVNLATQNQQARGE